MNAAAAVIVSRRLHLLLCRRLQGGWLGWGRRKGLHVLLCRLLQTRRSRWRLHMLLWLRLCRLVCRLNVLLCRLMRLLLKPKARVLCRMLWLLLKRKALLRTGQLRQPFGRLHPQLQMSTQLWLLTPWRRQRVLGISM